jgi:acetyl-CoA carboxylase biotin carboxyl carrier protein
MEFHVPLLQRLRRPCNDRRRAVRNENLTYEDVLRIVELVKSTPLSEFRLKVGEIEVHLRRSNGSVLEEKRKTGGPPASPSEETLRTQAPSFPDDAILVRAPMVGTFYRAPAPEEAPFVQVGQHVEPGATVCIIEVMKLMNSIAAEARGVVTEILVENGTHVEYGQVLMVIRPDPEDG